MHMSVDRTAPLLDTQSGLSLKKFPYFVIAASVLGVFLFQASNFQELYQPMARVSQQITGQTGTTMVQQMTLPAQGRQALLQPKPSRLVMVDPQNQPLQGFTVNAVNSQFQRTDANTFWVLAALMSLVANGVAAAFLFTQWNGSSKRLNQPFAMAATAAEEPAAEEEKEADEDEQADSPKAKLEAELEEVKAKLADAEKKYLYALAEIETIKRRSRQQVEDAQKFGIEKFAISMLEVADNMARGLAWVPKDVAEGPSGEENPNPDLRSLYGGMRSTEKIMMSILEKNGIQKYDPKGEIYDPNLARALAQVPHPENEPGTVLEVISAGYMLNGRVLRPADVVVVQDSS